MRKRRHALQVSTFPFLAVLLCAMGALILLLLVMDRRAKAAARARAVQKQQQLASARAKEREQRQAELERKRHEHAEAARREAEQLAEQAAAARKKAESVHVDLDKEERRYRDLQRQMKLLQSRLAQSEREVATFAAEADRDDAADSASRQERRRLTEQLAQLEAVLAGLKELREREKRTFSLVPYYGKRGQARKPIYVECQTDAVVFHPDARKLNGLDLSEPAIRREVEERVARQRTGPEPPAAGEAPYLFLLVRPEGVATYYLVQNSLQGLKVDFGYEFVDADWVLDFTGQTDAPSPWKKVAGPMKLEPIRSSPPPVRPARIGPVVFGGPSGGTPTGGGEGKAPGFIFPGMEFYLLDKVGPRGGTGVAGSPGDAGPGGFGPTQAMKSASGYPSGQPGGMGPGISGGAQTPAGAAGGYAVTGGPPTTAPGVTATGPPGTGTASGPARAMITFPDAPGSSQQGIETGLAAGPLSAQLGELRASGTGMPSTAAGIAGGNGPAQPMKASPDTSGQPQQGPAAGSSAGSIPALPGAPNGQATAVGQGGTGPGATGKSWDGTITLTPITPGGQGPAGQGGAAAGQPPGSGPAIGTSGKGSGEPSDVPAMPLLNPTPLPGAARGTKTAAAGPLPRTRVLNRDWVIPIECQADGVLLIPGRQRFSTAALAVSPGTVHPLALAVQELIARRQATVAPGDPPYRPRLLFQVRTEGLRSYYQAYPLLEGLRLPMARENVSARAAPSNRKTIFEP